MTLEAALQEQGIDPTSVSPSTKAQLQNVLLQKGKEVLALVLQILLNQNREVLSNSTSDAELKAQLEAARVQAELEAQAEADAKKKRQRIIIGVVAGVVLIGGVVFYLFTKKR